MQNQELGINLDQKIILRASANVDSTFMVGYGSFKNELQGDPGISKVSMSAMVPAPPAAGASGVAVSSAVLDAGDISAAARAIVEAVA